LRLLLEHFGTDKDALAKKIEDALSQHSDGREISTEEGIILKRNWNAVLKKTKPYPSVSLKLRRRLASYAAIILFFFLGVWLYVSHRIIKKVKIDHLLRRWPC